MANFFKDLKGKVTDAVKNIQGPSNPHERRMYDLVERATADELAAPDWAVNMELVDSINMDPQGSTDAVLRALRRAYLKPGVNSQLLSLTLLETCVKNCTPLVFQSLIRSELWAEIMRVGDPMRRWDPEVRDRTLCLVEDFGRGLPLPAYKEAFENLEDRGVDFPVRPPREDTGVPYYTPPAPATIPGHGAGADDLSPEDAAAINAALQQMEAEEAERRQREAALAPPGMPAAGHVPAAMGPALVMGAPIRPPGYHPPAGYHPPGPAATPAMVATPAGPLTAGLQQQGAGAGSEGGGVPVADPAAAAQAVKVATNSAELLAEMLGPLEAAGADVDPAALTEPFIDDLVKQCYSYQRVLADIIPQAGSDEQLIASALAANDQLTGVLRSYESLATRLQGAAAGAAAGGGTPVLPTSTSSGGTGVPAPLRTAGGSMGSQANPAAFTLLGDEDEEEASLSTTRGSAGGAAAAAAGRPPAAGAAAATDLIDLGGLGDAAAADVQQLNMSGTGGAPK